MSASLDWHFAGAKQTKLVTGNLISLQLEAKIFSDRLIGKWGKNFTWIPTSDLDLRAQRTNPSTHCRNVKCEFSRRKKEEAYAGCLYWQSVQFVWLTLCQTNNAFQSNRQFTQAIWWFEDESFVFLLHLRTHTHSHKYSSAHWQIRDAKNSKQWQNSPKRMSALDISPPQYTRIQYISPPRRIQT